MRTEARIVGVYCIRVFQMSGVDVLFEWAVVCLGRRAVVTSYSWRDRDERAFSALSDDD